MAKSFACMAIDGKERFYPKEQKDDGSWVYRQFSSKQDCRDWFASSGFGSDAELIIA